MIKKIIAIILTLILIVNMTAFAMGDITFEFFWMTIFISLVIVYFYFPKANSKKVIKSKKSQSKNKSNSKK